MRLLVIYYSQSGESRRVACAFADGWQDTDVQDADVIFQEIVPETPYPHPWRSIWKFFGVLPDCLLENPPKVKPPKKLEGDIDLVVLVYPVWFLSPALPIQSIFVQPQYQQLLEDQRVVTIGVCRSMWHNASECVKRLLSEASARHSDGIVVAHQGSFWATLVSTPRALLTGRKNAMLGVFPRAGITEAELGRIRRLGQTAAEKLSQAPGINGPLLRGKDAVNVKRRFLVPELVGWYFFYAWAVIISTISRIHPSLKPLGIAAFVVFLLGLIFVALPVAQITTWILLPVVGSRINRYAVRLAEPTGESL